MKWLQEPNPARGLAVAINVITDFAFYSQSSDLLPLKFFK